jgi:hypothetical protein
MEKAGVLSRYYELYEWDRFLFYRLRPNVNSVLLDPFAPPHARERSRWSVHTNTRGFRTAEFGDAPAPGVVRIAVLGDSSTFGWGVEHFETYAERLGTALAERWSIDRSRIEIVNPVPGSSSSRAHPLERFGSGSRPTRSCGAISRITAPRPAKAKATYQRLTHRRAVAAAQSRVSRRSRRGSPGRARLRPPAARILTPRSAASQPSDLGGQRARCRRAGAQSRIPISCSASARGAPPPC